jgi:hypothetical protein
VKTGFALGFLISAAALVLAFCRMSAGPRGAAQSACPVSDITPGTTGSAPESGVVTLERPGALPFAPALLTAALDETDLERKNDEIEQAAASVAEADLPAVLDSLAADASPEAAELRRLLVRRWAERDAAAAASWSERLPESASRDAMEQVAIAWANTDLAAAADWVATLPPGPSTQSAALGLAYEAARSNPLTALAVTCALPPSIERDDLLVHAASQWAGTDAAAAMGWAQEVPDKPLQQRLLAAVAIAAAKQDPAGAATLAANSLTAGPEQDRAAIAIVQRWAQFAPADAAAWVAQFPDSSVRALAGENLRALTLTKEEPVVRQ